MASIRFLQPSGRDSKPLLCVHLLPMDNLQPAGVIVRPQFSLQLPDLHCASIGGPWQLRMILYGQELRNLWLHYTTGLQIIAPISFSAIVWNAQILPDYEGVVTNGQSGSSRACATLSAKIEDFLPFDNAMPFLQWLVMRYCNGRLPHPGFSAYISQSAVITSSCLRCHER